MTFDYNNDDSIRIAYNILGFITKTIVQGLLCLNLFRYEKIKMSILGFIIGCVTRNFSINNG